MTIIPIPAERQGYSIPDGVRLYAVGDIHGRRDLLVEMLGRIGDDARESAAGRRVVVFVGDYVDRGPDGREVVEILRAGPPSSPEWAGFFWICLRGNHEDMMLRFLVSAGQGPLWMANGALSTLESYIGQETVEGIVASRGDVLERLREALLRVLPDSHREFLLSLPLSHTEGGYFFTHAGVRPGVALEWQSETDLLWIRDRFLESTRNFGRIVVHGHSVSESPEVRANRIGIDTGAFFTGRLSALVVEGSERKFIHT